MNKRVAKPKRKQPLFPGADVSDADMERWMRDNRAEINEMIREAQDDIAAGRVSPMPPLFEFLKEVRKHRKVKR